MAKVQTFIFAFLTLVVSTATSRQCPRMCFCYGWENLKRTNCIGKNLNNTFVLFPPETQVLDLSRNSISALHGNEFSDANLKNLVGIILTHNNLRTIDKLSFYGLEHLRFVDLSYNNLTYIPSDTFKFNPKFHALNLSNNPLDIKKDQYFLSNVLSLQVLNLANVSIKLVTVQTFKNLEELKHLNLSNNQIQYINTEALGVISKLKYLDISRNQLLCNGGTSELLQWLLKHQIEFQPFCKSQNVLTLKTTFDKTNFSMESTTIVLNNWEMTKTSSRNEKSIYDYLQEFFSSRAFVFCIICGVQTGILMGALTAFYCKQKYSSERRYRYFSSHNLNLASISIPPGTPPSPYRSRLILP